MTVDYLIIGAQKSGTTSLDYYLSQHPQISTAPQKEVHFFDLNFDKGQKWYESQFTVKTEETIRGEATPYYLFHPCVPQRVKELYPKMKIIIMLRNPATRAVSHYYHAVRNGFESLEISEAFKLENLRLEKESEKLFGGENSYSYQHHSYLSRGLYLKQIKNWMNFFDNSQILIISSEDFFINPAKQLKTIYSFLDVENLELSSYPICNKGNETILDINETLKSWLNSYYQQHNEELFNTLNFEFDWR